jgi:hypothetical protein
MRDDCAHLFIPLNRYLACDTRRMFMDIKKLS